MSKNRMMNEPRATIHVPYVDIVRKGFITDTSVRFNKYMRTDLYIEKDGTLYNLVDDAASEDLYIPLNGIELMQYQEHLDGPVLRKDEAIDKYPEEFI